MASYNLGNPSDTKKFEKDMKSAILNKAKGSITSQGITIECPKCKTKIKVTQGITGCPKCRSQINLQFNFDF